MGFGSKACMVFSYLNSICAFFIGWLFDIQINSFSIPTVENKWDKDQKAKACRHAAIMYLVLAVFMTGKSWWEDRKAARESSRVVPWNERLLDFDAEEREAAAEPLLASGPSAVRGLRREGSDGATVADSGTASARRNYGSAF